jgi:hypothetical protein
VFEISTFTARPDFEEDRIRLDAIDPAGQTQSILLTRRLCSRFIPGLVERVEAGQQPGARREIGLAMSQQQLRMDRAVSPLPDVVPNEQASRWLCRTIHLTDHPEALEWTLTDDGDNAAVMFLSGLAPREVLEVLMLIYRELEWGLEPFPEWLRDDAAAIGGAPVVLN